MKINTVCENRIFVRAYRKGAKRPGKYTVVYALKSHPSSPLKLGLTVTKGRGGAVVRSRIRRVLRSAFYDAVRRNDVSSGWNIIVVARDACISAKSTDISPELESSLLSLGVLSKKT